MSFSQLLSVIYGRRYIVWGVLACSLATAICVIVFVPPRYTSVASVVVDVKSPDPIAGLVMPGAMVSGYLATQIDVIQSEPVILQAIKRAGVDRDPLWREEWIEKTDGEGSFDSWLVDRVARRVEVRPSKGSNVISIAYTANDRDLAAAMTNELTQAYIDMTLKLRVSPAREMYSFFDERAQQLRATYEAAQARLSKYQRSKGLISTDEQFDVETAKLNELMTQLVALQAVAAEADSKNRQVGVSSDREEVLKSPVIAGLTSDLTRQEARLMELSDRYGNAHPQVRELKANIQQIQSKIATETKRIGASVGVSNVISRARLADVEKALTAQRVKVLRIKADRDEAAVRLRDVESAQKAYEAMLDKVTQTGVESQQTQTNVIRLRDATPSSLPSFPRPLLSIALALVVGTMLGVGLALLREHQQPKLRMPEDIHDYLGLNTMAILPVRIRKKKLLANSKLALLR